jgi:MFS family permease
MGAAIGPIIGGIFTTFLSWRLVFGSEIVIVAIIFFLRHYLSESTPTLKWKDLDIIGAVLSILSLILIVLGILFLSDPLNWGYVAVLLISGLILFALFLLWQRRRVNNNLQPLTDISLLKNRIFGLGTLNSVITQIPLAGFLFITPVFLQQVTGLNAFDTGFALLPASITILIVAIVGARLAAKIDTKYIVMAGFLVSAAGLIILAQVFNVNTQISDLVPGSIVFGIGIGLLMSQLTNLSMSGARNDQETDASGLFNSFKNLGYSIGTALIGVFLIIGMFWGITAGIESTGQTGNATTDEIQGQLIFNYFETMQTGTPPEVSPQLQPYTTEIIDSSISSAMKQSFYAMALIMILGFITSIFIPKRNPNI